jgi:hypothetical protein
MRSYENRSMASNVSMGSGVHDPIQRRKPKEDTSNLTRAVRSKAANEVRCDIMGSLKTTGPQGLI